MQLDLGFLIISVLKIAAVLAWIYGLLWGLGHESPAVKAVGSFSALPSSNWRSPSRSASPPSSTTSTGASCFRRAPWPWWYWD